MDVFETIKTRRSVRRFLNKPVENEKLESMLEAARMAPSWSNLQCWKFIVIKDGAVRKKISELTYVESFLAPLGYKANPTQKGLAEAPIVIIACADPSKSGFIHDKFYYLTDIGIAAQNLMLSAHALGLGTVFVGVFDEEKVRGLLNIPPDIRVVGLFPVGYPLKEKKDGPLRKAMNDIVSYEKWC